MLSEIFNNFVWLQQRKQKTQCTGNITIIIIIMNLNSITMIENDLQDGGVGHIKLVARILQSFASSVCLLDIVIISNIIIVMNI